MKTKMEYLVVRNVKLLPNESRKQNWTFLLIGDTESEIKSQLERDGRISAYTTFSREFLTAKEASLI